MTDGLDQCRCEEFCNQYWKEVEEIGDNLGICEVPIRRRKQAVRLSGAEVEMNDRTSNTEDNFRRDIYLVIDNLLSELRRRFGKSNLTFMNGVSAFSPNSPKFLCDDFVLPFASIYNCHLEDINIELENCRRMF